MLNDPDGKAVDYRFVEINPAFERQTGLHEAVGKTIRQMVPNHEAYWFEIYGKVSRTGEAIRFENAAVAMKRYYDVFAFRIGGEGSQRVGILFNDIAERKRSERALRDSEAALAEAQQIAYIGSWILYPESGELRASVEMFRMFAVDPGPVALLPLFIDRIHDEDRAGVKAGFAAAVQTGTLDLEFRIVTPDGTRVARAVARKREVGESHLSLIGTTRDITEQKAAEEAIRQHGDRLERSNLELERFNRLAVGRELRMIELKQQINDLCAQSGQPAPYVLPEECALAKETL
jgi:PAS domain-containing protein